MKGLIYTIAASVFAFAGTTAFSQITHIAG